jgi:cytochrome c5
MIEAFNKFLLGAGLLAIASQTALADESVNIPFRLAKGQVMFELKCSACHGATLMGTDKGPPLIHPFYKPSHHDDDSFYRAGLKGVRAHHWNFGDMPPVEGMTQRKMKSIIEYIRYYQQQKELY